MITEEDKEIILQCAKEYDVSCIILFGSSIKKDHDENDIDIAVKGIKPELFFKFYTYLYKHLSKPVDLVDLSRISLFNNLIEETGIKIYG